MKKIENLVKLERPNLTNLVRLFKLDFAAELHSVADSGEREAVPGQQRLVQNWQDHNRELHQPKCTAIYSR